jgi:GxxExxY protein
MTENEIAKIIVDAAYKIHTLFGPGMLESAYEALLVHELKKRGVRVECQQPIPIHYESVQLEVGFRADLIVEESDCRAQICRASCAGSQETVAYLSQVGRQAAGPVDQFWISVDQGRDHKGGQ